MSSLRERLEALKAIQSYVESRWEKPGETDGDQGGEHDDGLGGEYAGQPCDISRVVDGDDEATPLGTCFHRRVYYPIQVKYGHLRLSELLGVSQDATGLLAQPRQERLDIREAVFLDTETTGLAGGVGTYAFLVGVGHFEGDAFLVHQFFLRDYPDEPALLWALNEILSRFKYLVTFCGRGFDWPLLETRFTFNRMRPAFSDPVHLDLIHPARRLWKERWGSCRLANLEDKILGAGREDDVPGALIPGLYFDYLRTKDARPLAGVLKHNELDIVALVALAAALGRRYDDPVGNSDCPYELRGLGRQYESLGYWERAAECYDASFLASPEAEPACEALFRRACLLKRLHRFEEAAEAFGRLTGAPEAPQPRHLPHGYVIEASIELAKYYEHRAKDMEKALLSTDRALQLALRHRRYATEARHARTIEALRHRRQRLQQKCGGK